MRPIAPKELFQIGRSVEDINLRIRVARGVGSYAQWVSTAKIGWGKTPCDFSNFEAFRELLRSRLLQHVAPVVSACFWRDVFTKP